jgi:hypothetical protein
MTKKNQHSPPSWQGISPGLLGSLSNWRQIKSKQWGENVLARSPFDRCSPHMITYHFEPINPPHCNYFSFCYPLPAPITSSYIASQMNSFRLLQTLWSPLNHEPFPAAWQAACAAYFFISSALCRYQPYSISHSWHYHIHRLYRLHYICQP